MPAHLRVALELETAAHLAVHGSRFYELLRNDERFIPWTGTHLGHRGEKYFDRVVARVRLAEVRRARQRTARGANVTERQTEERSVSAPPAKLGAQLGNAGSPSFAELMADHQKQRETLTRQMASCYGEDGIVDDFTSWTAAAAQLRKVDEAILKLSKQYQGNLSQAEVRSAMFERLGNEFREEPERGERVLGEMSAILERLFGMAGTQRGIS